MATSNAGQLMRRAEARNDFTTVAVRSQYGALIFYLVPRDMDVMPGDWLVVDVAGNYYVLPVMEVHPFPNIDPKATWAYKWAIDKVDFREYFERRDSKLYEGA